MNNIYRLVWNKITDSWVAVAETTRARSKGAGKSASRAFIPALIVAELGMSLAWAAPLTAIVPVNGKTTAYTSANGVPVVNIDTANAKGLSHNYYTSYSVDAKGVVLNNGNSSETARQSQLAGHVNFNPNLANQATIILNEVVSTNRSVLAGFTEVLGGKADVIVANPNGITCNGCGFINTDRVTLTTGVSNVAGDGSLTGFTVNRGDVLIEGLGLNASTQTIFDIVTRSVMLDGKINLATAGSLGLFTGNNIWDYSSRSVTGSVAGVGAAPAYAIDSTILGGMYAGRITIIAREAGVGVRMLADAAANIDDFTVSSAGKIEVQSAISAKRNLSITSTSATGTQDIYVNGANAKLSASNDLTLSGSAGEVNLNEGTLYAGNNLSLTGATLNDFSSTTATRFAQANNTITTTGAATINGGAWGANGALSGTFGSLSIGANGAIIYAGTTLGLSATNDLALGVAGVESVGDMTLNSSTGEISTAASVAKGIQTTQGNLNITAGNGLTNSTIMTADAGNVTVRVNGAITNSGTIHAKNTLDIADQANGAGENIVNRGTLLSDGDLIVKTNGFSNFVGGAIQGTTGTTFTAGTMINGGTFTASNTAGKAGNFTVASLLNSGTLQSIDDLNVNATSSLSNFGKLLAIKNLTVNAGASALNISNTNTGVMQAGNALTVSGANATWNTQAGTVLGNTVGLTLSSLNTSGTLQSNSDMNLAIGNQLTNSGTLLAKGNLASSSSALTNSGTLEADQGSTINVTGSLTNTGKFIASNTAGNLATLNVGTLSNSSSGVIQSTQDLDLNVSGSSVSNAGTISAANNLKVTYAGGGLSIDNLSGGYLQAGNNGTVKLDGMNIALNNNAGAYVLGNQLDIAVGLINNSGTIQGGAAPSLIASTGTLNNLGTLTLATASGSTSSIDVLRLNNSGTLQSASDVSVNVTNLLNNSGTLYSGKTLVSTTGNLTNSGTLEASEGSTTTTGTLTNTGKFITSDNGHDGTINATTLTNSTANGFIQSGQNLTVNLSGNTLTNSGRIIANDNLALNATGAVANINNQSGGYLQAGKKLSTGGTAVTLGNATGAVVLGDQLAINAASVTNAGTIQGGSADSNINVSGTLTNTGSLTLATDSAANGTITADLIANSGTLQSLGNATLNLDTGISNNGKILTDGALTFRGTGSTYHLNNVGRIQSGGVMDIKGLNGSNGVDVSTSAGGVIFGNSLLMNAGTLNIGNNGTVTSTNDMTIAADNMTVSRSTSRIVGNTAGGGTATVTVASALTNNGMIYSGGDLNLGALLINNSTTGGIAALNILALNSNNIINSGALYGGAQVNINAPVTFSNTATLAAPQGTINSDGTITINTGTFINNSLINASGDITISAQTLKNEVVGGDTRQTVSTTKIVQVPTTVTSSDGPDKVETQYWSQVWTESQSYAGGAPGFKPQIISGGGTLTLRNFDSATNLGGVISAPTVNISGRGGSTFTNDDLSTGTKNYKQTWEIYTKYIALGPLTYVDHVRQNDVITLVSSSQLSNVGAGIFATNLNAGGFALVNAGSPLNASINGTTASSTTANALDGTTSGVNGSNGTSLQSGTSGKSSIAGVVGTTTINGAPAINFGGLVIVLPTNPNGFFVIAKDPKAKYLIETNPLFKKGSDFVGSDYLNKILGYNPDTDQKRLGDSNYEAYLIQQQLINKTGRNLLGAYDSEASQLKGLMDEAAVQNKRLSFVFGHALTEAQMASLTSDIVWMVETTVAGEKVLVPVVYLAPSTKNAIDNGAVIAGTNVDLKLTSMNNVGGTVSGTKSLQITSDGDIINTSGMIKGGDVSLKSEKGSVINKTFTTTGDTTATAANNVLGKTGTIKAADNVNIVARKDIVSKGANISADRDANLDAGGDITLTSVEKQTREATFGVTKKGGYETVTSFTDQKNTNVGSKLDIGGNLNTKAGRDINIEASDVKVIKNASLDAGRDINIKALGDTNQTKLDTSTSSWNSNSTEKTSTDKTTGAASALNIGRSLTLSSGGDANIKGSDVKVGKDLNVSKVGGDLNVTTFEETSNIKSDKSTSAFFGGVVKSYADDSLLPGGSVNINLYTRTSDSSNTNTIKNRGSSIDVGGNLNAGGDAIKGDANIIGSKISTGGDLDLAAKGNVNVLAAKDKTTLDEKSSSVKLGITADGTLEKALGGFSIDGAAGVNIDKKSASLDLGYSVDFTGESLSAGISLDTSNKTGSKTTTKSQVSELKAGRNIKLNAGGDLVEQGTAVDAGGNIDISANSVKSLAAEDKETKTGDSFESSTFLGAKASILGQSAELNTALNATSTKDKGTTTKTSKFTSGGDTTITARKGDVTLKGTNIDAGGSIALGAEQGNINVLTANDKSDSSSTANAANLSLGIDVTGTVTGAGSGSNEVNNSESLTENAAKFKAGKNVDLTAKKNIKLAGTSIDAGDTASLTAKEGTIDFAAARENTKETSSEANANASLSVNVSGNGGGVSAGGGKTDKNSESSKGTVGTINARNVNLKSAGDTTLEGTQISAKDNVSIDTGGKLDFKAVEDTSLKTAKGGSGSLGVSVDSTSSGLEAGFSVKNEFEESSTKKGGSISASNLTMKHGDGARLEGTQINVTKDASIDTGAGKLVLESAVSTLTKTVANVDGSLSLSKSVDEETKDKTKTGVLGGKVEMEDTKKVTNQNASIKVGGKADIKAAGGIDVKGANVSGVDSVVNAGTLNTNGANTTVEKREDVDKSTKMGFSGSTTISSTKKGPEAKGAGAASNQKGAGPMSTGKESILVPVEKDSGLVSAGKGTGSAGKGKDVVPAAIETGTGTGPAGQAKDSGTAAKPAGGISPTVTKNINKPATPKKPVKLPSLDEKATAPKDAGPTAKGTDAGPAAKPVSKVSPAAGAKKPATAKNAKVKNKKPVNQTMHHVQVQVK